jgi:hypothetical protein
MGWQDDYRTAYQAARSANESRYNQILSGYDNRLVEFNNQAQVIHQGYTDRYYRGMNHITGVGRAQYQDLNDSYSRQSAKVQGGSIARGLGLSTVANSMQRGVIYDKEKAKIQLADTLAREYLDTDAKLSGDVLGYADSRLRGQTGLAKEKLDFMERRTDAYPDVNTYAAMAARGGPGMGGVGGGIIIDDRSMGSKGVAQTPSPALMAGLNSREPPMMAPLSTAGGQEGHFQNQQAQAQNNYNASLWAGYGASNAAAGAGGGGPGGGAGAAAAGAGAFFMDEEDGYGGGVGSYGGGYSQPFTANASSLGGMQILDFEYNGDFDGY